MVEPKRDVHKRIEVLLKRLRALRIERIEYFKNLGGRCDIPEGYRIDENIKAAVKELDEAVEMLNKRSLKEES